MKLDGGNAKAHYRKAQALESLGQLTESEEAYEAGLSLLPDSDQLKKGLAAVRVDPKPEPSTAGNGARGSWSRIPRTAMH